MCANRHDANIYPCMYLSMCYIQQCTHYTLILFALFNGIEWDSLSLSLSVRFLYSSTIFPNPSGCIKAILRYYIIPPPPYVLNTRDNKRVWIGPGNNKKIRGGDRHTSRIEMKRSPGFVCYIYTCACSPSSSSSSSSSTAILWVTMGNQIQIHLI